MDKFTTTVHTHTSGGELSTDDGPFASDTVTNIYSFRQRTGLGLQQPTGRWTNQFNYDAAKRLYNVISPAGTFAYTYDSARLRLVDQLGLPNGSFITNRYDGNARLLGTWLVTSGSTVLDAATYGYNAGNQRTAYTNAAEKGSVRGNGILIKRCRHWSRPEKSLVIKWSLSDRVGPNGRHGRWTNLPQRFILIPAAGSCSRRTAPLPATP